MTNLGDADSSGVTIKAYKAPMQLFGINYDFAFDNCAMTALEERVSPFGISRRNPSVPSRWQMAVEECVGGDEKGIGVLARNGGTTRVQSHQKICRRRSR